MMIFAIFTGRFVRFRRLYGPCRMSTVKAETKGAKEAATLADESPKRFIETYDMKEPDFDFEPGRPSEVLFSNLEALKNRLHLLTLMKYPDKIQLDASTLQSFRQPFQLPTLPDAPLTAVKNKPNDPSKYYLRFETFKSAYTGLKDYIEPQDANIMATFHPKY